jgi:hypothetical protein
MEERFALVKVVAVSYLNPSFIESTYFYSIVK